MADTEKVQTTLRAWLAAEEAVTERTRRHLTDLEAWRRGERPELLYPADLQEIDELRRDAEEKQRAYAAALKVAGFFPPHGLDA